MLSADPATRPAIGEVHAILMNLRLAPEDEGQPHPASALRGKGCGPRCRGPRAPSRISGAAWSGSSCVNEPTERNHERLALPSVRRREPRRQDLHRVRCHGPAWPGTPDSRKVSTPQCRRAGAPTRAANTTSPRAPRITSPRMS